MARLSKLDEYKALIYIFAGIHLKASKHHLPYALTQMPPDTDERVTP